MLPFFLGVGTDNIFPPKFQVFLSMTEKDAFKSETKRVILSVVFLVSHVLMI